MLEKYHLRGQCFFDSYHDVTYNQEDHSKGRVVPHVDFDSRMRSARTSGMFSGFGPTVSIRNFKRLMRIPRR
jgi:hypothetical protein